MSSITEPSSQDANLHAPSSESTEQAPSSRSPGRKCFRILTRVLTDFCWFISAFQSSSPTIFSCLYEHSTASFNTSACANVRAKQCDRKSVEIVSSGQHEPETGTCIAVRPWAAVAQPCLTCAETAFSRQNELTPRHACRVIACRID